MRFRALASIAIALVTVAVGLPAGAIPIPVESQGYAVPRLTLPGESGEYGEAVKALGSNNFDRARQLANGYVAQNPSDSKAHLLFILASVGAHRYKEVETHISEVTQRSPELGYALRENLATFYLDKRRLFRTSEQLNAIPKEKRSIKARSLQAAVLASQSDIRGALELLIPLTSSQADNDILLNAARLSLASGDYPKARDFAKQLSLKTPNHPAALMILGSSAVQLSDDAQSRAAFVQLSKEKTSADFARFSLGLVEMLSGDKSKAAALFTQVPNLDGKVGLAITQLMSGQLQAAQQTSRAFALTGDPHHSLVTAAIRAANKDPGYRADLSKAGGLFTDLTRSEVSAASYSDLAAPEGLRVLAIATFVQRHTSRAPTIRFLNSNASIKGPFIGLVRARSEVSIGNLREARAIFGSLRKEFPDLIAPTLELADLEYSSGNGEKAVELYRSVMKARPKLAHLHVRLGDLLNAIGKPTEAVTEYEAALESLPDDAYIVNQFAATSAILNDQARMRRAMGMIDSAIASGRDAHMRLRLQDTRADVLFKSKKHKEALTAYQSLVKQRAIQGVTAWRQYGTLLIDAGSRSEGMLALERALDTGTQYSERASDLKQINNWQS